MAPARVVRPNRPTPIGLVIEQRVEPRDFDGANSLFEFATFVFRG